MRRWLVLAVSLVAVGLLAAGCGSQEAAGTSTEARQDTVLFGQEARVGEWTVMVARAELDATGLILQNKMYDPPRSGYQYVLVTLRATNQGSEPRSFFASMTCRVAGSKGDTFRSPKGFTVPPKPMALVSKASPQATVVGDYLFEVASDQVSGSVLMIEPGFSEEERVAFALE